MATGIFVWAYKKFNHITISSLICKFNDVIIIITPGMKPKLIIVEQNYPEEKGEVQTIGTALQVID